MDRPWFCSLISRSTPGSPCHAHPAALRSAPAAGELCLARGAHGIGRQESAEMPQGATRTTTHGSHGFYGDMGEHGQSPHVLWENVGVLSDGIHKLG